MTPITTLPTSPSVTLHPGRYVGPPEMPDKAKSGNYRLLKQARQSPAATPRRTVGFAKLPSGFDGSKKEVNETAPGTEAIFERRALIPRGMVYQSATRIKRSAPSLHDSDTLNFQLLNYLPRNHALLRLARVVVDRLEVLAELDTSADDPQISDDELLGVLQKSEIGLQELYQHTRAFTDLHAPEYPADPSGEPDPRLLSLEDKLTELDTGAVKLGELIEDIRDRMESMAPTTAEATDDSEDSSSLRDESMDFTGITRFAQSDARSTIQAMFQPLKTRVDAVFRQREIAWKEPEGSPAWCDAVASIIDQTDQIDKLLRDFGQQYADDSGADSDFLDWIDRKIDDSCDERDGWVDEARRHAQAMRQNGHDI